MAGIIAESGTLDVLVNVCRHRRHFRVRRACASWVSMTGVPCFDALRRRQAL
jgi:hypothetical protein